MNTRGEAMATAKTLPVTVPPIRLAPAYTDRDAVWRVVVDHAPYPLMAAGAGYGEMMQLAAPEPWFRTSWAAGGRATDAAVGALLDDERFIGTAAELFGARIVRPRSLTVNVMGPMDAGHRHVDVPSYRGFSHKVPIWFPMVMGVSGLFDRWAIRVAGAVTWFYDGMDGEYEYWPRGIGQPSQCERGPFGNVALFGDNDLMFHQVGPIGDAQAFRDEVVLSPHTDIRPGSAGWELTDAGSVLATLRPEQVRISLLWKAITFRDDDEARIHDEHEDDLDIDTAVSMFCKDLADRGVDFAPPRHPFQDQAWSALLTQTYLRTAFL
ncbi:hypothetical protein DVS77_05555 [Mycolicibacterium moriokaense]|nr:hypothetical protein DVS77_05555 [Mycolicibacterium moriokaense]